MALIVNSPLGLAFRAIRENDRRAGLIGINVYRTRLIAFVIAGALAGCSGALFALFGRYASASYMFYHVSGEAVVWAIVCPAKRSSGRSSAARGRCSVRCSAPAR
jgi:branched-chain amino acid transport system permease protein